MAEEQKGIPEEVYKTEVSTLEEPLLKIAQELKPHLEAGEYSLIIGDDTSGRLPTLVVHNLADYISEHQNLPKLPTVFVQAGRKIGYKHLKKQVEDLKNRYKVPQTSRALVVTESVSSGESINILLDELLTAGIATDLVSVVISGEEEYYRHQELIPEETRLFYGYQEYYATPKIWSKPTLTGLKPARKSGDEPTVLRYGPAIRQDTLDARDDVGLLSKTIISNLYPS